MIRRHGPRSDVFGNANRKEQHYASRTHECDRRSECDGYLHHARRGQHREEQVESSDVSSNTKRRMPWSAISQCRLRRLRLRPRAQTSARLRSENSSSSSMGNTGTHLHVSRKAICRPKQQLHVSTSMESPMSFVSRPWMFLIPSVTRFWCETPSSVSIL